LGEDRKGKEMRFAQFLLGALAILLALPFLVLLAVFLYYDGGAWAITVRPNGLRECVFVPGPIPIIFIFAFILAGFWTTFLVLIKKWRR
jgi:hypothetical protein